jgi:L-alanine-DL-glutamate epimerase-like enolase superfamily enzyme
LARDLEVPLSLDESVTSTARLRLIARHEAATLVCVKPPRVGGLAVARTILTEARVLGLRAYVGGFFESPLARRVHACLAASQHCEPSDISSVHARGDEKDVDRALGLGTIPSLDGAMLLESWEIT